MNSDEELAKRLAAYPVKIFADGARLPDMLTFNRQAHIKGFTTNPTLMRADGVTDYQLFAREVLRAVTVKPVSFEVFSDEFPEMRRQAKLIAGWADNAWVKIPITNTRGESACPLIGDLARDGVKLNITALFTLEQTAAVLKVLPHDAPAIISIFGGRIADAGIDPCPLMAEAVKMAKSHPRAEILWASPREVFNLVQAAQAGCQIITIANDILKKLPNLGKDLTAFSLDTVKMFYNDAQRAGYVL